MSTKTDPTIKLYIVTNNPARALMAALACDEQDRPDWCGVLDDPDLIDRMPDGVRAIGLFYNGRYRSAAERAWRDRRAFGGISGLSDEDLAWIEAWIEKRNAAERRLALGDLPDRTERLPEPATSVVTQVPDDFRAMALSQRWA